MGLILSSERVDRRLAAVLAADVAGYSRLMGLNEERTLANLKSFRKTLVDPSIAAHRGRIVKTTGDGMLVEFACRRMSESNSGSAFTSGTSSSTTTIFSATASISPPGWRGSRSPAVSASPMMRNGKSAARSISHLAIWVCRR